MSKLSRLFLVTNNPANIRYSKYNNWIGLVCDYKGFCKFTDRIFGLRALMVLLRNYLKKGLVTPEQIITRFAPPSENDTKSYIRFVEDKMSCLEYSEIRFGSIEFFVLIIAICQFETGFVPSITELNYVYERFFK